jgi:primosomal protein N' (replication factor Y)
MHFYLVWVSSPQFKSSSPLTYSFNGSLKNGSIVKVPFKNTQVIGLVDSETPKPSFPTKDITDLVIDEIMPVSTLKLFDWLSVYYPASSASHLRLFLPSTLLKLKPANKIIHKDERSLKPLKLPPLTSEQVDVLSKIRASTDRTVMLHGDTSSGKTRIYIELIHETLKQNHSAIILTPEIGLTPQLIKVLKESFGEKIVLIHSSLTAELRRDSWLQIIADNQPKIIVGPRSALFSPINKIGLIVMDEAHEASYKQEQSPYYQTSRVAAKLSELNNARLIFGTATPLVSDYYILKSKKLLTVRMIKSAVSNEKDNDKAQIETVKITERDNFTKATWLSDRLIKSISKSLNDKEQSIVFLNRRGTAQVILCQKCGWQALCPNCDTTLTYHGDTHKMLCHSCSFNQTAPSLCPTCGSPDIIFKGTGTKAITDELRKIFPAARISRFDKDNKKADSLEQNYKALLRGDVDIIVGTQIITKGLDLPKLSTVGIIMADSGLSFPDYTAEERTFQNLMQVIGRVARGHTPGRVIVQAYHPESLAIKSAVDKDFQAFYDKQILERKKFKFPPFVYLLKISCKRSSQKASEEACNKLIDKLSEMNLAVVINGPSPAFYEKQNGRYVWQIIIKSAHRGHLLKIIENLPSNFSYDIDPASLL